jgi:hypothetical protein
VDAQVTANEEGDRVSFYLADPAARNGAGGLQAGDTAMQQHVAKLVR